MQRADIDRGQDVGLAATWAPWRRWIALSALAAGCGNAPGTMADAAMADAAIDGVVPIDAALPKALTAFAFLSANNPALSTDITGSITGTTIAANLPFGTSLTSLKATFSTTGTNAKAGGTEQVSGVTSNDFTNPVVYRVTAADSSTTDYTVRDVN